MGLAQVQVCVKLNKTLLSACSIPVPVLSLGAAEVHKTWFPSEESHSQVTGMRIQGILARLKHICACMVCVSLHLWFCRYVPYACTRPLLPICVSMCACWVCRSSVFAFAHTSVSAALCNLHVHFPMCYLSSEEVFWSLQKDSVLSLFPRSESWSQPGLGTVTDTAPSSVNISCTRCRIKWLDGPWAVLRISLPENPFHSPLPETSLLLLVFSRSTEILHFVLLYLLCHR